jgi:hypothetical protein
LPFNGRIADDPLAGLLRFGELLPVDFGHHADEASGFSGRMPFDAGRTIGNDLRQRLLQFRRGTQVEPHPTLATLRRQSFDRLDQRIRMPDRVRLGANEIVGNLGRLGHGYYEDPGPGLRKEVSGVDDYGAGAHPQPVQRGDDGLEFLAAVDRKEPHHVLKHDDPRQAAVRPHLIRIS